MKTWFRLPQLVRAAVMAAGWFAYANLVLCLLGSDGARRIGLFFAISCVLGAAITTSADIGVGRRFGPDPQLKAYFASLRTGALPEDADVRRWWLWLHMGRRWNLVEFVLVSPFVAFGLVSSVHSQSALRWPATAIFAAVTVGALFAFCRTALRNSRLTTAVKRRHQTGQVEPAAIRPSRSTMTQGAFDMSRSRRLVSAFLTLFAGAVAVLLIAHFMPIAWAVGLAAVIALACVMLGEDRDLHRNFSSYDRYLEYSSTVRTGVVPTDIEPAVWHTRLKTTRRENVVRALLAAFLMAVGIAAILSAPSVYHWVVACLFELVAIWLLLNWWTARARLTQLAAAVDRHAIRQTWG